METTVELIALNHADTYSANKDDYSNKGEMISQCSGVILIEHHENI